MDDQHRPSAMTASCRRFFLAWGMSAIVALLTVATVNLVVDPYRVWRVADWPAVNGRKPALGDRGRLAKPYQVADVRPNALIIGNSRAEIGIDPSHPAWAAADRPVFNLALPGASLALQLRLLQHAVALHRPRTVVLALDFVDFIQESSVPKPAGVEEAALERRLAVTAAGEPTSAADRLRQRLADGVAMLLSLDALADSLLTVVVQGQPDTSDRTPLGLNPAADMAGHIRREGQAALFAEKEGDYRRRYAAGAVVPALEDSAAFASFRAIIALCRREGIDLRLYIHPYHARFLDVVRDAGLWPAFVAWKQAVAGVVAEASAGNGDRPVRLWDFSTPTVLTTEPVPPPGDRRTAMRWHWEAGHYTRALGDVVLDQVLDGRTERQAASPRKIGE